METWFFHLNVHTFLCLGKGMGMQYLIGTYVSVYVHGWVGT